MTEITYGKVRTIRRETYSVRLERLEESQGVHVVRKFYESRV